MKVLWLILRIVGAMAAVLFGVMAFFFIAIWLMVFFK